MSVHPKRPNTFDGGSEASSEVVGVNGGWEAVEWVERKIVSDGFLHFPMDCSAAASFPANCKRIKNASLTTRLYTRTQTSARVFCRMCVHLLLSIYLVFGQPFSRNRVRGQDLRTVCPQYLSDPVGLKMYPRHPRATVCGRFKQKPLSALSDVPDSPLRNRPLTL